MRIPLFIGKIAYITGYPFILLRIRGSHRIYVVIRYKNSILVTKNWLGLHKKWRLPGGGAHKNELPTQSVIREVKEELSLTLKKEDLVLLTDYPLQSKRGYYYQLFVCTVPEKPQFACNIQEIVEAQWLTLNTLEHSVLSEELQAALRILKNS